MLHALTLSTVLLAQSPADDPALRTVAEASDYEKTATHAEVMTLLEGIAERSEVCHVTDMGRTVEGRAIPLAILADPPVATPAEAHATGKPVVFAFGNIHAGEVCGKEALLMLAREVALTPDHPLLEDLVILVAPILNGDGNEKFSPDNRPGQVGPVGGMGERPNADGLDLNRDWVKLESPEIRSVVRLLNEWDPHLTIDTHTTNGSRHRYTLTYASPTNPSGHEASIEFIRDEFLPTVTERLRERTGYDSFFYGNLSRDQSTWRTYSADPRFGGPYRGLRGQMSILSEAYAYASYRDRCLVTLAFVREILGLAAEEMARLVQLHDRARVETSTVGEHPQPDDVVGLRFRPAAFTRPVVIKGYAARDSDEPRDLSVVHVGRFEPTVSVRRPRGYLFRPDAVPRLAEKLLQHGVWAMGWMPEEPTTSLEAYTVRSIDRAERAFQGHHLLTLDVVARTVERELAPGYLFVPTAQPLGTLVVYLLEPRSTDGLAAWGFMDEEVAEGEEFPVYRLP